MTYRLIPLKGMTITRPTNLFNRLADGNTIDYESIRITFSTITSLESKGHLLQNGHKECPESVISGAVRNYVVIGSEKLQLLSTFICLQLFKITSFLMTTLFSINLCSVNLPNVPLLLNQVAIQLFS